MQGLCFAFCLYNGVLLNQLPNLKNLGLFAFSLHSSSTTSMGKSNVFAEDQTRGLSIL